VDADYSGCGDSVGVRQVRNSGGERRAKEARQTKHVILAKARIQVVTCAKRIMAALRAEDLRTGFQPSLE
jgi:hypothetical protein